MSSASDAKKVVISSPDPMPRKNPNRAKFDYSHPAGKHRSPAYIVRLEGVENRWQRSAGRAHTKLERMSPKAIPSVFTYQDEDSDVDVAIQFFERDDSSV